MPRRTLSISERKRRAELMDVIDRTLGSFVECADALREIRDDRLYEETHLSFDSFVLDTWSMSGRHARRLIAAGEVAVNIQDGGGPMGPVCERQARALVGLRPVEQRRVWRAAVQKAPVAPDGRRRVTERVVRAARREVLPDAAPADTATEVRCPRCRGKGTVKRR